ncbi:MAG: alpha/beta fold hydrolase [Dehalococcoidia bacterium]|nr:alpha/beta fold hydrolase [Dehalococcoidia bacterium]
MPPGLLLLHAFPLDASMWRPQVAAFEHERTVVAPNLPGFGGELLCDAPLSIDLAADHAAAAVRAAGLDSVVVCGLSMGGYVALGMWRRHRDLVAGLVLANTRANADDAAGQERRRQLAARLRAEGNGFLAADPPPLLSSGAPGELLTLVKATIASQPAEAIAQAAEMMAARPDATASLADISVPALVISSDEDTLIPPDATQAAADAIPGARFVLIQRAGHLSNLEQPVAFNRLLRNLLERV